MKTHTMPTFTIFLKEATNLGTTNIITVRGRNLESATKKAKKQCCTDWGWSKSPKTFSKQSINNIHVLGAIQGDVNVLEWNDIE